MGKQIATGLGKSIDKGLSELDALLSDGSLEFITGLWDGSAGGFYYSPSARDYKGYSPDIDSTLQALRLLSSGAVQGIRTNLEKALPEDIKNKILSFAEKNSVREREIKEILGVSAVKDGAKSTAKENGGERFESEDELISRLDELFLSGTASTKLDCELEKAKKANLSDALFDYLDKRIENNIENGGIFSEKRGFDALSELHRIGALYIGEKRKITRAKEISALVVRAILSETPKNILEIYSAWAGLRTTLQSVQEREGELAAESTSLYSFVRANAVKMLEKTVSELSRFKKSDGGYSYFEDIAPAGRGGVRLALGVTEGEMNSTVIALHGIRGNAFYCIGLTTPPLFDESAAEYVVSGLIKENQIKKRIIPFKMKIKLYKKRT